jgi:hypothetical protein
MLYVLIKFLTAKEAGSLPVVLLSKISEAYLGYEVTCSLLLFNRVDVELTRLFGLRENAFVVIKFPAELSSVVTD